jgi:hypothetical protein
MPPEDPNTGIADRTPQHGRESLKTNELTVGQQPVGESCSAPDDRRSCEREGHRDR